MAEYPESEQLEWNSDTDNFNVLHRADILVSDFSGVFYDFAFIHNKPIIYTDVNFNLDVYDAWWIQDRPLWLYSALPRIGCKLTPDNMSNIKELIDECLTDEYYAEGRQAAKNETWANIGRGAEIVTDYLINKQKELSDKEEK